MIPYFTWWEMWLGSVRVNIWGLLVGLGFLTSLFFIYRRAGKMSVSPRLAIDIALWVFLGAVVGGRLGFVAMYQPAYFAANPGEILAFWNGGMSSIGGMVGAFVMFMLWTRRTRGMRLRLADVLCYSWPFGWAVGRLGCFFIHDHPGTLSNSVLAVRFPDGSRLDMGLLEALVAVGIGMVVYTMGRRSQLRGSITAVVALSYGLTRFVLDFWRARDIAGMDARYAGLTPAQYAGVLLVVIGVVLWVRRGTEADADRHGVGVV